MARWEAASGPEPPRQGSIHADALAQLLQEPANDQMRYVIICGWHPLVVAALTSDAVLSRKTWIWLGSPAELRAVARDLTQAGPATLTVIAKVVDDATDLVPVVAGFPVPFSVIDLGGSTGTVEELRLKQRQSLMRVHLTARKALVDVGHLLARRTRLRQNISLAGLAGLHAGRTAVCIAAGPTQDRALQLIRDSLPECIVICVDIVQERLAKSGIRVDYVVNLDSGVGVARRIGGSPDARTILVMPIAGHRDMEAGFGRVSYMYTRHAPFEGDSPADRFWHGTNVGAGTVGLAIHLGCTEVLLVGHDLSFTSTAYYAESVAEMDGLQNMALRSNAKRSFEIPGNAGGMVESSLQFSAGVDDIAYVLARNPQVKAWNLAANLGVGALIAGTSALPQPWSPAPSGGSAAPAQLTMTEVPALDPQAVLAQCRAVAAAWSGHRAAGKPIRDTMVAIEGTAELRDASQLLAPFINGYLVDALRLMALPAGSSGAPVIAEVERCCDQTVRLWFERIERAIATDDWKPVPKPTWADPAQREWLGSLLGWRIALNPASSQITYLNFCAREYSELLKVIPQAPLPAWQDLPDWTVMANALWPVAPPAFITRFIEICELLGDAGVRGGAAKARELGIAAQPLSDDVAAYRRLRQGISTDLQADAVQATAWLPLIPLLVGALLAEGPGSAARLRVLEQLIRSRRIPVGDVLIGRVVVAHPDISAACALFEGHEPVMGEATTLAMAQRLAAIGNVDEAITNLVRIRALSGYAGEAWKLLCRLLTSRLGAERMLQEMQGMWPQGQAALAVFVTLGEKLGAAEALLVVDGWRSGALPIEVLATMAQSVIAQQRGLPAAVASCLNRMLDETSALPGEDASRVTAIRTLLGRIAG